MKNNDTIKTLITALLLCSALCGTRAASLITDGDFDALQVGTAPDVNKPAGHWFWRTDEMTRVVLGGQYKLTEDAPSDITIVPAPPGGIGNALRFSNPTVNTACLPNILARPVTQASGEILYVSFNIYVERGGGYVSLGVGPFFNDHGPEGNEIGPQLYWDGGNVDTRSFSVDKRLVSAYPRKIWQTVQLVVDMARQRFDFYWSEKGQSVSVTRTNLPFLAGPIASVDRFMVFRGPVDSLIYLDNVRVTTDPAVSPVNADLAAGGARTLTAVNLRAGDATFQWRRNGTDIPRATAAKLELINVTADQAGEYTLVVTGGGQSVTTDTSTVRVFDRLTVTTPPVSIEAVVGKTTGFSVVAVSALPMTYQWRFNGADMPGKTNRFLTFSANAAAAGDYTVVVSDAKGSITSEPATLRVLVPVTFTQAPLNQRVVAGGTVTLSAAIQGTGPFTFQLRKGSAFDSSTVKSTLKTLETTAFFTLTNVQPSQAGAYRLYVTNPAAPTLGATSPSRSWTLTVLPDTDGDGLPDEWETAHGLNPADPSDALLDSDGDGIANLAEYRAGTDPTKGDSGLRLESVAHANGKTTVTFAAAANQTYTIEASPQAAGGAWEKVADVVGQPAERMEQITHDTAAGPMRFYRIVTPRRP